jgi:hypothetical protein
MVKSGGRFMPLLIKAAGPTGIAVLVAVVSTWPVCTRLNRIEAQQRAWGQGVDWAAGFVAGAKAVAGPNAVGGRVGGHPSPLRGSRPFHAV